MTPPRNVDNESQDWTGDHDWATSREAALHLKVTVRTIQRYVRDGTLDGIRVGGRWRIRRISVETLLGHPLADDEVAGELEARIDGHERPESFDPRDDRPDPPRSQT